VNAIIFLNYKPIGRCNDRTLLLRNSDAVAQFFKIATGQKHHFKVGFDSCLVSGLVRFSNVSEILYDGCDAGRFSMFISENMEMYPCSFMVADYDGIPIRDDNMLENWQSGVLFAQIRKTLATGRRQSCAYASVCLGGCPVFEEINLCSTKNLKRDGQNHRELRSKAQIPKLLNILNVIHNLGAIMT
jgi:radical SAM protein with 4Fe4S-binding SPASM domain